MALFLIGGVIFFNVPSVFAQVDSGWESRSVDTGAGIVSVQLIRINLNSSQLQIKSLTGTSGDCDNNCITRSLQSYVDQVNGFAGINGSYFCPADYGSCSGEVGSFFWLWYNSSTGEFTNSYQNQFNQGPVIAFDTNNNFYYYRYANDWPGKAAFESQNSATLAAAISNGPGLVYAGDLIVTEDQLDNKQRTVKSNRSGIGYKLGNIYLAVASSATVMDLGRAMDAMGMEYAMNLDGGGSSTLYYQGQYGVGPGRNIPNSIVFIEVEKVIEAVVGSSFFAYDSQAKGGWHVRSGNVIGDSSVEIITGTDSGSGPQVRVLNSSGQTQSQFFAFDSNLRNGVSIAACDVDGDGTDEIVASQGKGALPVVKIFKGDGTVVNSGFNVLDGKFTGGVNLSCGDTDGDGTSEIVVAAQQGGGPHVLVYNSNGKILTNFMAYDPSFRGGINVSTLDMDGDGRDEIVTGPQFGAPHVQIFQIRPNELKRLSPGFYAFHPQYRGGVSVAGVDTDGDGVKELVVGVGENALPSAKVYSIREELLKEMYVFDGSYLGGVHLDGGDVDGDGIDELIVIPRSNGGPQIRIINVDEV